MIEKTEEERISKVNEARRKGLLSEDVFNMVEDFTSEFGFARSSFIDGVANPGTKSAKSLVSKLDRKMKQENDPSFTLAQTWDIVRCSIIVDNYEQVVPLIKELQKSIPGLKGDVSENDTGYRGVHLSFTIDGFRTEMQISTRDAWYVKQAGEEVYARWRDFNLESELEKLYEIDDPIEREKQRIKIIEDLELKQEHNRACREMFERLHENTDFEKWKNAINAALVMNSNYPSEELPKEVIERFNVRKDGSLSDDELYNKCDEFSNLAKPSQEKLISIATKALGIAKNMGNTNPNDLLTYEEKTFILLKQEYAKILVAQSKEKYGNQFAVEDHVRTINAICNERSLATIEYCREKGIKISSYKTLEAVLRNVNQSNTSSILETHVIGMEKLDKRIAMGIKDKDRIKEITGKRAA